MYLEPLGKPKAFVSSQYNVDVLLFSYSIKNVVRLWKICKTFSK